MINTKHLLKVSSAWISIVYIICFVGVAMFPSIRTDFMTYGLHTRMMLGDNLVTLNTFISGLIIWNIIGLLGVWLFAALFNGIKK